MSGRLALGRLAARSSRCLSAKAGRRANAVDGPGLDVFIRDARRHDELPAGLQEASRMSVPASSASDVFSAEGEALSYFIETYGCQMNVSDSEIVAAILEGAGFIRAPCLEEADVILSNTCAVRDNAEQRVLSRINYYGHIKGKSKLGRRPVVGVLGCMAERMKTQLLEENQAVDLVVGPDSYRDLPSLVGLIRGGHSPAAVSVQLSAEETYADVAPVRLSQDRPDAFVSIMRGCNNMCSFCIVPFTRGRERSRAVSSVVEECRRLVEEQGVKEVVLLGQNVNSYHDKSSSSAHTGGDEAVSAGYETAPGFGNTFKARGGDGVRFAELLHEVASAIPEARVRFTSPHPKDFPLPLLQLIAETPNLCNSLHLPAQSGSTEVLSRMRRNYSREAYLDLAAQVRATIPGVTISTDMISGFCGETEQDHEDTLSLMREVAYEQAFMFHYSKRDRTLAARDMDDDVPLDTKLRRLREVIDVFMATQTAANEAQVGTRHIVLVEGPSRRASTESRSLQGRTDCNRRVVFPEGLVAPALADRLRADATIGRAISPAAAALIQQHGGNVQPADLFGAAVRDFWAELGQGAGAEIRSGHFVVVDIIGCAGKTLIGLPVAQTSIGEYDRFRA